MNYARLQSRRPSCRGVARDTLLRPNPQKAALLAMDILRMSVPAKAALPTLGWLLRLVEIRNRHPSFQYCLKKQT